MGFWSKKNTVMKEDEICYKEKMKRMMKRFMIILVIALIYAGVGFFIAYIIASRNDIILQDAGFTMGCLIIVVGLLTMMGGNRFGIGSWDTRYSTAVNLLDITLKDEKSSNHHSKSRIHSVTEFTTNRFTFIFGGILLVIFSILFL